MTNPDPPGDARQQAAEQETALTTALRELKRGLHPLASVNGARLTRGEADAVLAHVELLLVRVQEQADEIAKHAKDLKFFNDNTDEYFAKWRDAERRVQEAERALRDAPMPIRESVLLGADWDDTYDEWWHANASEEAIARASRVGGDVQESSEVQAED